MGITYDATPREASELDALRKDREDGATTRYGILRPGTTPHILEGAVGLGTRCGATVDLYLPARDATKVCKKCTKSEPR
ncbi:hypothetical protein [Nocardiopsis metallicus]|uniref:Uncharacterized protein n=1 Tax=Nocardiopsis metallicus TaxID=179819 RepID=A0A840W5U8_9ACTN|nr:hypothetical protein [Nocardiopsis metallicus]MBB5491374.1 hypothetical protein [Nocardiopsis metallicus]